MRSDYNTRLWNKHAPQDESFGARNRAKMTLARAFTTLVIAGLVACACIPADGWLMRVLGPYHQGLGTRLGGDVKREFEFLQQFGSLTCSVVIGVAVLLTNVKAARRIPAWVIAALLNALCYTLLKIFLGRPRPRVVYHEHAVEQLSPWSFGFFWKTTPLPRDADPVLAGYQPGRLDAHSYAIGTGISSDLWSMPSSHSAAAFLLSAVLSRMYPKLTPLLMFLACFVAFARVVTGAHFVSDVIVGGALGWVVGTLVMDNTRR